MYTIYRLLHAQAGFCYFKDADNTFKEAEKVIDAIGLEKIPNCLLANWYVKISTLNFAKSDYDMSYLWGVQALHCLTPTTPDRYVFFYLFNKG